jgi:hypothetical protein
MQKLFKMSDLGLVSYYLGIEVAQGDIDHLVPEELCSKDPLDA